MRIVVPAMQDDCVASRCLRAEGLDPEVVVLPHDDPHAYARLVAQLWRDGETFAIVEHDIAPWPGAVRKMLDCAALWCGFYYPLPGRWDVDSDDPDSNLFGTTGCYKVDAAVMDEAPDLYKRFEHHEWRLLDCGFIAAMRHLFCLDGAPVEHAFHLHSPPVAHAIHYEPETPHERQADAAAAS